MITEIKAKFLREFDNRNLGMFASSALTGNSPQFVAEQLIRASARIGVFSALAGEKDPMVLVRYLDNLRTMAPLVILGEISPECAVLSAI